MTSIAWLDDVVAAQHARLAANRAVAALRYTLIRYGDEETWTDWPKDQAIQDRLDAHGMGFRLHTLQYRVDWLGEKLFEAQQQAGDVLGITMELNDIAGIADFTKETVETLAKESESETTD